MNVKEFIQAGDTFLLKFNCPNCSDELLAGFPLTCCTFCLHALNNYGFDTPLRKEVRLLAGSFRKRKGGLSKKKIAWLIRAQEGYCAYCYLEMGNNCSYRPYRPLGRWRT